MPDPFRMNDLTLIQSSAGSETRVKLRDFVQPVGLEGISDVCRVPREVQSMNILVPGSERVSNFKLYEFCNQSDLVKIHPALIVSLQAVRDALNDKHGGRVGLFITCGFRSHVDQKRLAEGQGLGWVENGGKVARDSMHIHGLAADFHAFNWKLGARVDKNEVYRVADVYFDYVKKYPDTGHIHGDMRAFKR